MPPAPLEQVLARLDELNRADPNHDTAHGIPQPRELVYAQRLTEWVLRLEPQASEALRIAARGQHVQRWTIPRSQYPMTRQGYLRWRETLKTFHAKTVAELMREAEYDDGMVQRVSRLITKKHLGTDPEVQTLEDALCLLFLEAQFSDLKQKTADEKMRDVVRKTWRKMSPRAHVEARRLALPPDARAYLADVLGEPF
jgi:hypothetical protein